MALPISAYLLIYSAPKLWTMYVLVFSIEFDEKADQRLWGSIAGIKRLDVLVNALASHQYEPGSVSIVGMIYALWSPNRTGGLSPSTLVSARSMTTETSRFVQASKTFETCMPVIIKYTKLTHCLTGQNLFKRKMTTEIMQTNVRTVRVRDLRRNSVVNKYIKYISKTFQETWTRLN